MNELNMSTPGYLGGLWKSYEPIRSRSVFR
jgi:hypothetical protein